jgi:hypothetical protein
MNTSLNFIGKELHTTINGVLFVERIYGINNRGLYQTSLTNTVTGNVTYNLLEPDTLQDILDEGIATLVN